MRFRAHWGEEDIRSMIREELTAPPHLERVRNMVQEVIRDNTPPPAQIIERKKRWWQFVRSKK